LNRGVYEWIYWKARGQAVAKKVWVHPNIVFTMKSWVPKKNASPIAEV
jgi:hypothetical protein